MGIYSNGELIYGIPVVAWNDDDDGAATPFWIEENDDWRQDLPPALELEPYGHYGDSEASRAILSLRAVPSFRGDCWDPTRINPSELIVDHELQRYGNAALNYAGLPGDFHTEAAWYLVASVG